MVTTIAKLGIMILPVCKPDVDKNEMTVPISIKIRFPRKLHFHFTQQHWVDATYLRTMNMARFSTVKVVRGREWGRVMYSLHA